MEGDRSLQISDLHDVDVESSILSQQQEERARIINQETSQQQEKRKHHCLHIPIHFDSRLFASHHRVNADAIEDAGHKDLSVLSAHPETLRIIAYLLFWLMILLCIIITELYVDPDLVKSTPLSRAVGYNNLCTYFDFPPSRYIAAMIFPIVLIFYFSYLFLNWLRMRKAGLLGIVSRRYALVFETLMVIEVFFITWFQLVFVVDVETSVYFHTLSFVSLQVGLILNEINSFAYYSQVVHYTKAQLTIYVSYLASFILVTIIKNIFTQSALIGRPVLDYTNQSHLNLAKVFDILWMILGAILPMFIAYILKRESSKLSFTF